MNETNLQTHTTDLQTTSILKKKTMEWSETDLRDESFTIEISKLICLRQKLNDEK